MSIRCVDWRSLDAGLVSRLYAAEADRWRALLGWDTAGLWPHVERGRQLGTVTGFVADDSAGWAFAAPHRGTLQIGGLVAETDEVTGALVDRMRDAGASLGLANMSFFGLSGAPGLPAALSGAGLTVDRYDYMERPLDADEPPGVVDDRMRSWQAADAHAAIEVLSASYPEPDPLRPFATGASSEEWREYVGQLLTAAGCGEFLPDNSFVVPGGLVIVTRLAETTAHVAQVAVAPDARRAGLGRALVDRACDRAALGGYERMTLLVGRRNHRARGLYERAGFRQTAAFTCAARVSRGGSRAWPRVAA